MGSSTEYEHFAVMLVLVMGFYPLFFALVPRRSEWPEQGPGLTAVAGRFPFFDLVKGLAIIAVVLIHVTLLFPVEQVAIAQSTLDLLNNILRFAIAFFLIASGMLLQPVGRRLTDWKNFYTRKVSRIVVPYLLVVVALGWYQGLSWSQLAYQAVTGEVAEPFYFMSILIQLYILYPLLQRWATSWWFVVASLGLSMVAVFLPALYWWQGVPLTIPYLFFFVWGIYMRSACVPGRLPSQWPLWVTVVGLYVVIQGVVGIERMYNLRFFFGPAAFLLVYWIYMQNWFEEWFVWHMAQLGRLSLWVFLLHFPILQLLVTFTVPYVPNWPWTVLVGYSVLGVTLSIIAAVLVSRVYAATVGVILSPPEKLVAKR